MPQDKKEKEALLQNLQDAGCTQDIIEQFIKNYDADNSVNQISILAEYRNNLLSKVHEEQGKLDCLDYLLFQLRKERKITTSDSHAPHIDG